MAGTGKKKIDIKKIEKKSSRMVTFSKRRSGLMKKAMELEDMTGARVALVVFSPGNNPYTYGDIPAMSKVVERMTMTSNNNSIVPYGQDNNTVTSSSSSSSLGLNYDNLLQWLDNINVDEYNSSEELKNVICFN